MDELPWRPTLMFVARSWDTSGRLDGAADPETELKSALASDGGTGLPTVGRDESEPPCDADAASPLPEPRIRPPPSLRPVMMAASWRGVWPGRKRVAVPGFSGVKGGRGRCWRLPPNGPSERRDLEQLGRRGWSAVGSVEVQVGESRQYRGSGADVETQGTGAKSPSQA